MLFDVSDVKLSRSHFRRIQLSRHGQNGHPLVARQFAPATLAVGPRCGADRTAEKGDACDSVERVYLNAPIGSPLVGLTGKHLLCMSFADPNRTSTPRV